MKTPSPLSLAGRAALSILQKGLLGIAALSLIYVLNIFGLMLCVFLGLFYAHAYAARRRNFIKNFNSALRTTIQINGHIEQTAEAFSYAGPIKRQCANFARRLTAGEEPFDAAIRSRVPIELETGIALTLPDSARQLAPSHRSRRETARQHTNSLSITSQLFYLIIICATLILTYSFYVTFIAPTMETLRAEMLQPNNSQTATAFLAALPITAFLIACTTICFYLVAVLGLIPSILNAPCIPLLPVAASHNSAILTGLATTIDRQFSLNAFCQIGTRIYRGTRRRQFQRALRELEKGYIDTHVIHRAGWINAEDLAWLENATPTRQANILRNISRQNIRHADANLNWIMAIAYPAAILCLATAAAPFAASFFSQLTQLITQLS